MSLFLGVYSPAQVLSIEPQVEQLLNELLRGLQLNNTEEAEKIVAACVHGGLLNTGENRLSRDVLDYSFKKARESASLYQYPVQVVRVREKNITSVGNEQNAESGRVVEYYLAKKNREHGLPAPVQVFFPSHGGKPKILYIGGL